MTVLRNDAIFLGQRGGMPAVVTEINEKSGQLKINANLEDVKKLHPHGFINGLPTKEREEFNNILDTVSREGLSGSEKVEGLREKIEELETNQGNHKLVKYLKAELFHLMRKHKYHAESFSVNINSVTD